MHCPATAQRNRSQGQTTERLLLLSPISPSHVVMHVPDTQTDSNQQTLGIVNHAWFC